MKNTLKILFLSGLFASNSISSQKVATPYEIGTWQGFKDAAISYTFDDNCPNQLAKAVPLFDRFGFKTTLFTVINWNPNWAGLQAAAAHGHEIASHTVTHTSLDSISFANQTTEFCDSKRIIIDKIPGQKCITIAYPFCSCGNRKLCAEYYIAARSCDGYLVPSTPPDFMCISSVNCGTEGEAKTAEEMNVKIDSAISQKEWCVFMIHGIDDDQGYSPLGSDKLEAHLKYVDANSGKYWVNTFGNVIRYIRERNAVSLDVQSVNSKSIHLQLTDTLDNSIYNYPVSVRRPMPKGWKGAMVQQGTAKLPLQFVSMNQVNYIQFDAIPNAGTIVVNKQKETVNVK